MGRLALCLALVVLVGVEQVEAEFIVSWGRDDFNQVTNTPSGAGFTAIAGGGTHSLALASSEVIPEPSTLAGLISLARAGGIGFGWRRRRKA